MAGWYDVKTGEAYIYLPHKTEETTVRLDNLAVARKMEEEFNDKKSRIEKLRQAILMLLIPIMNTNLIVMPQSDG